MCLHHVVCRNKYLILCYLVSCLISFPCLIYALFHFFVDIKPLFGCNLGPVTIIIIKLRSNPAQARCTRYNIKVCQWFATGRCLSPVSSTSKFDAHDITEILLKVALTTCRFLVVGNIFRLETCMSSLVKVPPYSKWNFQGETFSFQTGVLLL
jgi:hypothetical protein